MDENKIVIYQTEDGQTQIDVHLENETVWLTQAQMAELFQKDQSVVARHINNAIKEGELDESNMHFLHNNLRPQNSLPLYISRLRIDGTNKVLLIGQKVYLVISFEVGKHAFPCLV